MLFVQLIDACEPVAAFLISGVLLFLGVEEIGVAVFDNGISLGLGIPAASGSVMTVLLASSSANSSSVDAVTSAFFMSLMGLMSLMTLIFV
jgi:hypothetical protein